VAKQQRQTLTHGFLCASVVGQTRAYKEKGKTVLSLSFIKTSYTRNINDSLAQLGEQVGHDFSYDIQRLEEDIAEAESQEEHEELSEGSGLPQSATRHLREVVVTDDDVRQMFKTLSNG
jgi:hypothetical protein